MFNRNEIGDPDLAPVRVHYPWTELEEYQPDGGMWHIPALPERQAFIEASQALMADPDASLKGCGGRLTEWPRSCAVASRHPG